MSNPGNPFEAPGERDLRNMGGILPSHSPDIFKRPASGTGGRRKATQSQETPPEEIEDFPIQEAAPAEESRAEEGVQLRNPAWSTEEGIFNENVTVSVEGAPPQEKPHLTRVVFTLFAVSPEGARERIESKEGHLQDGKVCKDFTLYYPTFREDGNLPNTCKYLFTAKHKESKELASGLLMVEKPPPLPVYNPGEIKDASTGCLSSYDPPDTDTAFA